MYNASLTSFLAVHKTNLPYNDVEELYLRTSHKVVTVAETSYIEQLKTGSAIERSIYAERLVTVPTIEEGLQKTYDRSTAFIWTTSAVNLMVGRNCSHSKIPRKFFTHEEGWAVRKDFPYKGFIQF